jgi:hypothetical protein
LIRKLPVLGDNQIGDYDYYIYDNPRLNPKAIPADPVSLAKLKEDKKPKVRGCS